MGVHALAAVALLAIYVIGTTAGEFIHHAVHDHVSERLAHTPALEKDPCHRSIVHADPQGCGHKAHFSELNKHKHTHVLFPAHTFGIIHPFRILDITNVFTVSRYRTSVLENRLFTRTLRGPPRG